jgi:Flp pilus assembly CpaF family ATPase
MPRYDSVQGAIALPVLKILARRGPTHGYGLTARIEAMSEDVLSIENIARACGDEISDVQPLLDARLEDGSRVAAMFPPCAVGGPALTIRKFTRRYSLEDLVAVGAVTPVVAAQLTAAIGAQHNILIAGGTGTGKTTLLNALAARIPDDDRIIFRSARPYVSVAHKPPSDQISRSCFARARRSTSAGLPSPPLSQR